MESRTPSAALRTLRGFVVVWSVMCLVAGVGVAAVVWQLSGSASAIETTGSAVTGAGEALERLGDVPVVGDDVEELAARVQDGGKEATAAAADVKRQIRLFAVLLGLLVAVLPTAPLFVLWSAIEDLHPDLSPAPSEP